MARLSPITDEPMRAGQSRAKPVRRAASNSYNSCFTSTDVYAKLQATVAAPCLVYGKLHYGCCPKLRPQPPGQPANTSKPSQVLCNSKTWKRDLHLKTWKVTCFQNLDKTQVKQCILKNSFFSLEIIMRYNFEFTLYISNSSCTSVFA